MRKNVLWLNISVGMTALLLLFPSITGTTGHGVIWGRIPNSENGDIWYRANSTDNETGLWTCVHTFNDTDEGEWTTGFTILDLEYRDASTNPPPENYIYFIRYMTIPWVAMTWRDAGKIFYPFADYNTSMDNQMEHTISYQFDDGNEDSDPDEPTSMNAQYALDVDEDDTADFIFEIWYQLNVDINNNNQGNIDMKIKVVQKPDGWVVGNDRVTYIEFPFLMNPDIEEYSDNGVEWNDTGTWTAVYEEGAFSTPPGSDCIKVFHGSHQIVMNPVDSGQRTGAWYVIKVDSGGQFSQYPDSYEDDENFVDADVEVWYIAGYSLPDDWPPTDGWTSANYHELTG